MTVSTELARLNVGSGDFPLAGWTNIDETRHSGVDLVLRVPPIPFAADSVGDIYCGHFLEHLDRDDARVFLGECYRVLVPGGRLGVLVPDMAEIFRRYVADEPAPIEYPAGTHRDLRDLDHMYEAVIRSTMQPSQHRWGYDLVTLRRALERAGFVVDAELDDFDPRIAVPAWYQTGWDSHKP